MIQKEALKDFAETLKHEAAKLGRNGHEEMARGVTRARMLLQEVIDRYPDETPAPGGPRDRNTGGPPMRTQVPGRKSEFPGDGQK